MTLRSTPADNGVILVRVVRISKRSAGVGKATKRGWSNRPGRIIAGSIISGLFVAAMTYTPFLSLIPSNSVRRVLTTLDEASDYNQALSHKGIQLRHLAWVQVHQARQKI